MTLFAVSTFQVGDADARRRKRRKKRKRVTVTKKAHVKALRELMGPFKFGMSEEKVVATVRKQIKERYADQIAKTNDVYEQDKLRTHQRRELKRLKKSRVAFDGRKSGWDVSLIDDQFTHGTDESMMVYWEIREGKNQRRFFFFHEGELYKMFVQLDTSKMGDRQPGFAVFRKSMERRFGRGEAKDNGIAWRLRNIHVDALDKLTFYNSFCLVMTHPRRAKALARLRADRAKKTEKYNPVIRSVVEDGDDTPDLNEGSHKIDRLIDNL